MTKRYTAIVEIVEVEETAERKEYSNIIPAKKETRELAKFVIRDEQLAALVERLKKHAELVN